MANSNVKGGPVLHVVLVGFHHKKGCQVEYCYPPFSEGSTPEQPLLPEEWKHLPSLALPDGAHNYQKDTVCFHLPGRDRYRKTVFGVSCYRQMEAKDLKIRTADVTRSTVQKSVCVLSNLPLYGKIHAKLEMITHAYFDERDFSQVALLKDTYENLNSSLLDVSLDSSEVYMGLSCRELIQQYKHKVLIIFKLLLLERRVLFFGGPVKQLTTAVLTAVSLFPGMLEQGLVESASYYTSRQVSPTMPEDQEGYVDVHYQEAKKRSSSFSTFSSDTKGAEINTDITAAMQIDSLYDDIMDTLTKKAGTSSSATDSAAGRHTVELEISEDLSADHSKSTSLSAVGVNSDNKVGGSSEGEASPKSIKNNSGSPHTEPSQKVSGTDSMDPLQDVSSVTHIEAVQGSTPVSVTTSSQPQRQVSLSEECFSWDEEGNLLEEINKALGSKLADQADSTSCDNISALSQPSQPAIHKKHTSDSDTHSTSQGSHSHTSKEHSPLRESFSLDDTVSITSSKSKFVRSGSDTEGGLKGISRLDPQRHSYSGAHSRKSRQLSSASSRNSLQQNRASKHQDLHKNHDSGSQPAPGRSTLVTDACGFPLAIYTKGSLLHPYLSLQYYDIMQDVMVRAYVVGATNLLFRHHKHLTDVVIEVADGKMEIHDPDLRRQLNLTTADLRFADLLVKSVSENQGDIFLDDTGWEGGDEWIRGQFKLYLMSFLKTVQSHDKELMEDFNPHFCAAYCLTHNYKVWLGSQHSAITQATARHPSHGQLSMADMKLRLAHTMQSTERGKKINAAVTQTGKAVLQTGKAVGGALNSARSAVSSWWSNLTSD